MYGGNEVLYFPLSLMVVGHLKFLGIYSYCLSKYRLCLEEIKCLNVMFVYLYFFQYNDLIIIVIKHKIVLVSHSNHHHEALGLIALKCTQPVVSADLWVTNDEYKLQKEF